MKKLFFVAIFFIFTAQAYAETCSADLAAGDAIKFDKTSLSFSKTCKEITVNLAHTGKSPKTAMGHNLVLVSTADITAVGVSAASAGLKADYVPKDKVIAHSKLVGGGEKTSMKFKPSDVKGASTIICTFPGHWAVMKVAVELK